MPDFTQRIEQECLQGSAIALDLFNSEIEIIEDTGRWEPNYLLGQTVSTQWQTPANPGSFSECSTAFESMGGVA